jgi:Bacterial Ig-like domain (group 1).
MIKARILSRILLILIVGLHFSDLNLKAYSAEPHRENSYLSCHQFSAQADGVQAAVIQVTVHDSNGLPLVGESVVLRSDRGDADQIAPATAQTDESGRVQFQVRSLQVGTASL